ncbi:HAD family hydrolase [Megalodesulfovibrio paquesii]
MIEISIPSFGEYKLRSLALDYNGTLALDGTLLPGVAERLTALAERLHVVVLTADTHGTVREVLKGLPVDVQIIGTAPGKPREDAAKRAAIIGLQRDVAVIGNGFNDRLALEVASLGVLVVGPEGASVEALEHADVMVTDIRHALDLLLVPTRLLATLRR